jgi:hypothetical protein
MCECWTLANFVLALLVGAVLGGAILAVFLSIVASKGGRDA